MLRALGAFLMLFWFLSLLVQLQGMVYLFGASALALFAVDLLLHSFENARTPQKRRESLF